MKTITLLTLALLCAGGCSYETYEADARKEARVRGYMEGWIDGHDGQRPTPDAPNSNIGKPDGPSPKAGEGK